MLLRLASAVLLTVVLLAVVLLAHAAAGASQQRRAAKQPAAAVSEAATVRPAGQADAMAQPTTRTCSVAIDTQASCNDGCRGHLDWSMHPVQHTACALTRTMTVSMTLRLATLPRRLDG